jgi:hypothetical protein
MRTLHQSFETVDFKPTKVEVYLRKVETLPPSPFIVSKTVDAVIDAPNFSKLNDIRPVTAQFKLGTAGGQTGSGYVAFTSSGSTLTYPIQATQDGLYNVWLRVRASAGSATIGLYVDGTLVTTKTASGLNGTTWAWLQGQIVSPDRDVHELSLAPQGACDIDKLFLTRSTVVPTGDGPSFSTPPYTTCHLLLYADSAHAPAGSALSYDAASTYEYIKKSDWFTFDMTPFSALGAHAEMGVTLNVSGSSSNRNLIWEEAGAYNFPSASRNAFDAFSVDHTRSMALRVYSDLDVDEYGTAITPDAKLVSDVVNDFDGDISPLFDNTEVLFDEYGTESVALNVDPKLLNIVVDQSGSNTWNDSDKARLAVLRDLLDTLEGRYPEQLRFNLFKIAGTPTFSFFIPLKEKITNNSVADIVRAFFKDDSYDFAGFRVLRKKGSYPSTPIDGEIVSDGYMLAALDTGLTDGTTYYYKIFTYDQLYRFSQGVELAITAEDRILPRGIASAEAEARKGYGPVRDDHTVALWHMDEGDGEVSHDFSDSLLTLTLSNARWLDIKDSPIGLYGIRFNGSTSQLDTDSTPLLSFAPTASFTIIASIFPLSVSGAQALVNRSTAGAINYSFELNGDKLRFTMNGSNYVQSNLSVTANDWNRVAVTYDAGSVTFFVNDVADSTQSLATTGTAATAMPVHMGWSPHGSVPHYFGKLSHVSVHDTARDLLYIAEATNPDKNLRQAGQADNGDRIVVIKWNIPDDYNFAGGSYRIVLNRQRPPMHESDGEIVTSGSATAGGFEYGVAGDYDLAHTYYYRLFSRNTLGNWSEIEDSPLMAVTIPDLQRDDVQIDTLDGGTIRQPAGPGYGNFPPPTVTLSRAGNEKVWLTWSVPSDDRISRVVVYYSQDRFPYFDPKTKTIVGDVVWDGTKDIDEFVHRKIANRQPAYYAVVTTDKYGHFSTLVTVDDDGNPLRLVPLDSLDDSGIPLLEPLNVRYHIAGPGRIEILWDSPVTFKNTVSGYFDDRFYVYAAICDIYGNPVPIDFPSNFSVTATVGETQTTQVEDAFNLGTDVSQLAKLPNATFSVTSNIVTGVVKLRNGGPLAVLESLKIDLSAVYKYSEKFTYTLSPVVVQFINPLALELVNKDNNVLNVGEFGNFDCEVGADSGLPQDKPRKRVNGCFIRRKRPLPIRARFTYKGNPIPRASLRYRILDDVTRNSVDVNPCSLTPNLKSDSKTVKLVSQNLSVSTETLPVFDTLGQPTDDSEDVSYTDMLVIPPRLPQSAALFVQVNNQGFTIVRKINLFFANILRIATSLFAPSPDGLDSREEFAHVSIIDPDNPSDDTLITVAPDNTIVKWEIIRPAGANVNVPFYSTDNVPLGNGVYSYTRRGTARDVFFGPAASGAAGDYSITASVTVDDLFASETGNVEIKSLSGNHITLPIPDPEAPRILAEFEHAVETIYADGVEWVKMWIWRNPSTSTAVFKTPFLNCSSVVVPLPVGQTIHIEAQGWQIISGATEDGDTLDTTNAVVSLDTADVKLGRGEYTNVYFRANRVIPAADDICQDVSDVNDCGCELPAEICGQAKAVVVSTKINYNGKPLIIYGGGALKEGRPPTVLTAREPLKLSFIGISANNQIVSDIVVDGVTENVLIAEVTWRGSTVPSGTPINIQVISSGSTLTFPSVAYVENVNDPLINPTGNLRSFAKLTLPPLPTDKSFALGIIFTTTYNEVGTVERKQQFAVKFAYVVQKPLVAGPPSRAISGRLDRYSISLNSWDTRSEMHTPRAAFAMGYFSDSLFVTSGTDGSQLLTSTEQYHIATDTWEFVANIPTPRMFAQTVQVGHYLYVIGGFSADSSGNVVISGAVERYNMETDQWTSLSDMPTGYEIALGIAQYSGGYIYVLSGYKNATDNYNDRVVIYRVADDSWSVTGVLSDTEMDFYSRVGAFSFLQNGTIYVVDGLFYLPPLNGDPEVRVYLGDAYKYVLSTGVLSRADNEFSDLPVARFLGQATVANSVAYFLGGVNADSNTLRYFESETLGTSPFTYDSSVKLERGRSAFGTVAEYDSYGEVLWVAGGLTNRRDDNFLRVTTEIVPTEIGLDGRQSAAVNIRVADENGDVPATLLVRVTGSTPDTYEPVIFTEDEITVHNGFAVATLLPRSDDPPTAIMGEGGAPTNYQVSVAATVLDSTYVGETDATVEADSGGFIDSNADVPSVNITVTPLYTLETVVKRDFAAGGAVLTVSNIGNIIDLRPNQSSGGASSGAKYVGRSSWIPLVDDLISNNEGTFDQIRGFLDVMDREVPFGGTPLLDGIKSSADVLSLDSSGVAKTTYVLTDGSEGLSHYAENDVTKTMNAVGGPGKTPVVGTIFQITPASMHLGKITQTSAVMDRITSVTGGGDRYVTSDSDIGATLRHIISTQGFLGSGKYSCVVDLGSLVKLEDITATFTLLDAETDARWRFALSGDDKNFGPFGDFQGANTTTSLTDTVARYIKLEAVFFAELSVFVYGEGKLVPPVLNAFTITYHQPTSSFVLLNTETASDEVSQITVTFDVNAPDGSDVEFGVSSFRGTSFEDYFTQQQPPQSDGGRIIVPIRRSLENGRTSTLEGLQDIDGFIFEASYGPWPTDAGVAIYEDGTTLVDAGSYKTFPDKGFVVFNEKRSAPHVIAITPKTTVNVAAKITNRVAGNPVVIHGAAYYYSTLKQQAVSSGKSKIIPEAINLLVVPLAPNVGSVFQAEYTYYDLSGRAEKGSQIRWYINGAVKSDLNDLVEWDNKFWNLAKVGDQVYFTVTPVNSVFKGVTVRSLPVTVVS